MGGEAQQVTVPESLDGARFDVALSVLAGVSRTRARRLIESGEAGRLPAEQKAGARPKTRVAAGDRAWFRLESKAALRPHPAFLDIRYEDPYLAVVNKPPGMVTHPGPGNLEGTLVSVLLDRWPEIEGVGVYPRWGIVHRLDKDTSGVMVIARREEAHRALTAALAARVVRRNYLALVHGLFRVSTGTIEAPIDRRRARRFVGSGGKWAVTHYRRLASWARPAVSLLDVTLETGRTHQIRVHLESIKRHVVGDPVYGRPGSPEVDPGRVWLHAHRLRFAHPVTGEDVDAAAPLPPDLRSSLAALGQPVTGHRPPPPSNAHR